MNYDYPYSYTPGGIASASKLIGERTESIKDAHILVAGAQYGELVLKIAERFGCKVTGIETDTEAVIYAKMTSGKFAHGGRTDFRFMEPDKMGFEADTFDIVIADNIFSMYVRRKVLGELTRVLKPGGTLGIMDSYWLKEPVPTFVRDVWQSSGHPVATQAEWEGMLIESGLTLAEVLDNSKALNRFYDQFTKDIKNIAASGFEGMKPFKSLVKHFKHEIDVYRKNGGNKYMGHILIRAVKPESP